MTQKTKTVRVSINIWAAMSLTDNFPIFSCLPPPSHLITCCIVVLMAHGRSFPDKMQQVGREQGGKLTLRNKRDKTKFFFYMAIPFTLFRPGWGEGVKKTPLREICYFLKSTIKESLFMDCKFNFVHPGHIKTD